MSFFNWITGGDFATNRDEGQRLFAEGHFGDARLAFQRALKKSKQADGTDVTDVEAKIRECVRRLAFQRIDTAREFFARGDVERGYESLEDALLISDEKEVADSVDRCRDEFAEGEETEAHDAATAMSDDDLLAVISGAWSSAMAAEFADYPESFYKALIVGHDGDAGEAARMMAAVSNELDQSNARYFFLELGRMQLQAEDLDNAVVSLNRFVARCAESADESVEELWVAHQMLATIHTLLENFVAAEAALMNSFRAAPDNHVPLLHLGVFLRERGELGRARRAFENAMDTMGAIHPDMRVFRELGHTHLAMGERAEAIACYKAVLDHCCKTAGHDQYDPEAAVPLAKLYEEDGKIREASDVFRHLANGFDGENHFRYHLESARLLRELKEKQELINHHLESASALARTPAEREQLAKLTTGQE